MVLVLKRAWPAQNGKHSKRVVIPEGRHRVTKVKSPFGFGGDWLVLEGTQTGLPENCWRQWKNGEFIINAKGHTRYGQPNDWDDREIIIEE